MSDEKTQLPAPFSEKLLALFVPLWHGVLSRGGNLWQSNKVLWLLDKSAEYSALVLVCLLLLYTNLVNDNNRDTLPLVADIYQQQVAEEDKLLKSNQLFLSQVEQQAMADFLLLTEAAAVIDVVKSSQIGVSFIAEFNVTVGQAINELSLALRRALEVNLMSAMAIKSISLIISMAEFVAPVIWQLTLWLWLVYLLFELLHKHFPLPVKVRKRVRIFAVESIMLFVTLHLFVPYSVHFSSQLSQQLSSEVRNTNQSKLKNIHAELVAGVTESKLKDKAETSISHLKKLSTKDLHYKIESVIGYFVQAVAVSLLDLFLMPVFILYGLYRVGRKLLELNRFVL